VVRPDARDRAFVAAWDVVIGLAPVTLAEAIAYAARHPSLNAGLVTVAGTPPDPARLGTYLASLSGAKTPPSLLMGSVGGG
jgi:hypothetical protein